MYAVTNMYMQVGMEAGVHINGLRTQVGGAVVSSAVEEINLRKSKMIVLITSCALNVQHRSDNALLCT